MAPLRAGPCALGRPRPRPRRGGAAAAPVAAIRPSRPGLLLPAFLPLLLLLLLLPLGPRAQG